MNEMVWENYISCFLPEAKAQQRQWKSRRYWLTPSSNAWAAIALTFDEIKQAPFYVQVLSDSCFLHRQYFGRMV